MSTKTKIIINSVLGSVIWESEKETIKEAVLEKYQRGANLRGADLRGADLRDADLRGANLRGADLKKLPTDFVNQCSRDMLFIFQCLKTELPYLREKLVAGEVDGSQYTGECSCLVGSLGKGTDEGVNKVCSAIPFYEKGTHNMGETWFLNIRKRDTPENNQFSAHVLMLIDYILEGKPLVHPHAEELLGKE